MGFSIHRFHGGSVIKRTLGLSPSGQNIYPRWDVEDPFYDFFQEDQRHDSTLAAMNLPASSLGVVETMFFVCFYMLLAFSFTDPSMDLDEMTLQSILPWMSMCFEKHPTMDDTQL